MRHSRTPSLVLVVAVLLSLSACTSTTASASAKTNSSSTSGARAAPTAAAVYQLMRKSGAAAKSVRMRGTYTNNGQELQIDAAGDRAGRTMKLLVNFGLGGIEVLKVNDDFYIKADAAFWTRLDGSAAISALAAGKYVKVPPGSAAGMGDFRLGALLDQVLANDVFSAGRLNTKVKTTDVDGVPAYLLTTKVGGDAKIYVSADGQARLLRAGGTKSGTLDFTEWDSVVPTSAPPANQLVKIPGL